MACANCWREGNAVSFESRWILQSRRINLLRSVILSVRNEHLLRHRVKGEEGWRHRRWLSLPLPLPVHAVFSFQVVSSAAISLSADWYPAKGMAVYSPDEGKLPSWKRPWATPRWQEDVVRAIALCPNEGPLIFTSDAGKWPVREREGRGEKRGPRQIAPRDEATIRFSLSLISPIFILTLTSQRSVPFPSNSLASSRRSFLVRHTICSCEGKRSGEMGTSIPDTMPNM